MFKLLFITLEIYQWTLVKKVNLMKLFSTRQDFYMICKNVQKFGIDNRQIIGLLAHLPFRFA